MQGKVIDEATGQPVPATVHLNPTFEGAGFLFSGMSADSDGSFRKEGLETGTYDLTAVTDSGLVGLLQGVRTQFAAVTGGLQIFVRPGAVLDLLYRGEIEVVQIHIRVGSTIVAADGLYAGTETAMKVPAGDIVVQYFEGMKLLGEVPLSNRAGERRQVILE